MSGPHLSLFGAPGTNLNLGLDALMRGTVAAVVHELPGARFTVFDHHLGVRPARVPVGGTTVGVSHVGARRSRRVTRPESYAAMRASLLVGGRRNAGARAVLDSAAVLDVSGGDSFSDLYGRHRFRTVCAPKQLALSARRPLVLLPQTYGPFAGRRTAGRARALVLGAAQAWARDEDSFAALRELLGTAFDPARHHLGVDLAVLLEPAGALPAQARALLDDGPPPVGVNVSGLLWHDATPFGLRADYRDAVQALVAALVRRGERVLLVPHVLGDGAESDVRAAAALRFLLPDDVQPHVAAVTQLADAAQAKAVIAACSWLVGARMHATIAALSSGVPCAAIAYSGKFRGVFATLGVADAVLDARALDTGELVDAVLEAFDRRADARARLLRAWPGVRARAHEQMATVLLAAR